MFFSCQNKTAHLWREKRNENRKSSPLKLLRKMQTKRLEKIIAQFVFTRRIICAFASFSSTSISLRDQVTVCWVLWNYHATTNHTKIILRNDLLFCNVWPCSWQCILPWLMFADGKNEIICWNTSIEWF